MYTRYVAYSPSWGVYLGSCFGLGFWSKQEPCGQDSAVAFVSSDECREFSASLDHPPPVDTLVVEVQTEDCFWARREECVKAGLPD